jgi:hypothetical protein
MIFNFLFVINKNNQSMQDVKNQDFQVKFEYPYQDSKAANHLSPKWNIKSNFTNTSNLSHHLKA